MRLQLNRIAHPVTVLGPGRRLGLWVQGCSIGCHGCASVDTWSPGGGAAVDSAELAQSLASVVTRSGLTGLSITGGEPTEQAAAVADVVTRLRAELPGDGDDFDVLLFTGLAAAAAQRVAPELWAVVDAAVCGPYRADRPGTAPLLASSNQVLVTRTPLGRSRLAAAAATIGAMQAHVADGTITMLGLPAPGDLPRIEELLRERGVILEGRSWLPQ